MKNKKLNITAISLVLTAGVTSNANATLASNAILDFTNGEVVCPLGGTAPSECLHGVTNVINGSYFGLDFGGTGTIVNGEKFAMTSAGTGITLGAAQALGEIDLGTDLSGNPWGHFTTQGLTVVSALGNSASLDMAGWYSDWQGPIPWGTGSNAIITCDVDCLTGESFTLNYSVINEEPGNFQGFYYELHLEGTIASAVPVPAAVWLFGSGLIGLFGFAKRRKS